jgi:hypothetical protein
MIYTILIVTTILTFLLFKLKRAIKGTGKENTIAYHFCSYTLEFLIPFTAVTLLYSIIPIAVSLTSENVSLQSLIYFEESIAKAKSYLSFLKLSANQVLFIFALIYICGLLRLTAHRARNFLNIFAKYRLVIRRVFIVMALLCSFTFFGTQLGEPAKELRLRIKTIRDGYADIRKELREVLSEQVAYGLFAKVQNSFPTSYKDALSLPETLGGQINSLRNDCESARTKYGIDVAHVQSTFEASLSRTKATFALNTYIPLADGKAVRNIDAARPDSRQISVSTVEEARSTPDTRTVSTDDEGIQSTDAVRLDPRQVSIKKVKEARTAVDEYRSRLRARVITLLRIEGGKSLTSQIPRVLTSEIKTVLVQSWIEAYPILEPIVDVFKDTIDKDIESRVEAAVDRVTSAAIESGAGVEGRVKEEASMIVGQTIVAIPEVTLQKAHRASSQLYDELANIQNAKAELDSQVKLTISWNDARSQGSVEAYETFLSKYPSSQYTQSAREALENANWSRARSQGSVEAYEAFLNKFASSQYASSAKEALDKIWDGVTRNESIPVYEEFMRAHGNSPLAQRAGTEIQKLFISTTPNEPSVRLNSNLSVDIRWSSVAGAESYRVYWSDQADGVMNKGSSVEAHDTSIQQWPNRFPVYYHVVGVRGELESMPSKPGRAALDLPPLAAQNLG